MVRLPEIFGALRCARMAVGVPALRRYLRVDGYAVLAAVDETVMPLVRASTADPGRQAQIRTAFRIAAVKYGAGIWSYTKMAGLPFRVNVVVLATAFTRLYDDLMDLGADDSGDERFSLLFAGGSPTPVGELESLAYQLFAAIAQIIDRPQSDGIYTDLVELHQWQIRSRRQSAPGVDAAELIEITRGKGGLGIAVMFGLAHPGITAAQHELLCRIGTVGQMLDDQHDLPIDRMDGITTSATAGHMGPWRLGGLTVRLGRLLRLHYGVASHALSGLFFLYQASLIFRRTRLRTRYPSAAVSPLGILCRRAYDIPPEPGKVFQ